MSGSLSTGRHSQHSEEAAGTYYLVVCSTSASGPPSLHPPQSPYDSWRSPWGVLAVVGVPLFFGVFVSCWPWTWALLCLVFCVGPLLSVFGP